MTVVIPIVAGLAKWITVGEAIFMTAVALYGDYQRRKAERAARDMGGISSIERTEMVRSSVAPRITIYGQSRVSGVLTYLKEVSSQQVYILVTLSGHALYDIRDVYLNDDLVTEDINGNIVGKYLGSVTIWRGLGTDASDSALLSQLQSISGGEWTANHKQSGCGKILLRLNFSVDLFPQGIPTISAVVLGKEIKDPRNTESPSNAVYSANPSMVIMDYMKSIDGLNAGDEEFDDDSFVTAANTCDEQVTIDSDNSSEFTAERIQNAIYAANSYRTWGAYGSDIKPRYLQASALYIPSGSTDRVYYGVSFTDAYGGETVPVAASTMLQHYFPGDNHDRELLEVQLNNIPIGQTGVTGRKIYRYQTSELAAGGIVATLSDNTTTTFTDYITGPSEITPGAAPPSSDTTRPTGIRLSSTRYFPTGKALTLTTTGTLPSPLSTGVTYYWIYISETLGAFAISLEDALAGNAITLTSAGTGTHTAGVSWEHRYTLHGTISADANPEEILRSMLTTCAGELYYIGGRWTLHAGADRSISGTITDDDIDGPIAVTTRLGRRAIFNGVKGVMYSPEDQWQKTDFPPVSNSSYVTSDQEEIWYDIELPLTISKATAQRIAKIKLEETRQQISVMLPCKLTVLQYQIGDIVQLTHSRFGWSSKKFKIVNYDLATRRDGNVPRFGVDITLREYAPEIYDWSSTDETVVDPAPDTDLVSAFSTPDAPQNVSCSSTTNLTVDGTVMSTITVSWDQTGNPYVLGGGKVEVLYQPSALDDGSASPPADFSDVFSSVVVPGADTSADVYGLVPGKLYWFSVRFINIVGMHSDSIAAHCEAAEDATLPADVFGLSFSTPILSWDSNIDFDLAGYVIKWQYPTDSPYEWETARLAHTDGYLTHNEINLLDLLLPEGENITVYVKAVDFSGNESETAAQMSVTVIDIVLHRFLLKNWTAVSPGKTQTLHAITWDGDMLCAVGDPDGTDAYILNSPDGVYWTEQSNGASTGSFYSIVYADALGLLIAVGMTAALSPIIYTSDDSGATWTSRTPVSGHILDGLAWSLELGMVIGVGFNNPLSMTARLDSSTDGITWSGETIPSMNGALNDVCWASDKSLFVAVGDVGSGDANIITSPDGSTWTERTNPDTDGDLLGVCYAEELGLFAAVGLGIADDNSPTIMTSDDGITWTRRYSDRYASLNAIVFTGAMFVAVGRRLDVSGNPAEIVTSEDGITWAAQVNPPRGWMTDIVWTGTTAVAVGYETDGYTIIRSLVKN